MRSVRVVDEEGDVTDASTCVDPSGSRSRSPSFGRGPCRLPEDQALRRPTKRRVQRARHQRAMARACSPRRIHVHGVDPSESPQRGPHHRRRRRLLTSRRSCIHTPVQRCGLVSMSRIPARATPRRAISPDSCTASSVRFSSGRLARVTARGRGPSSSDAAVGGAPDLRRRRSRHAAPRPSHAGHATYARRAELAPGSPASVRSGSSPP